jgi:hypothetical protein
MCNQRQDRPKTVRSGYMALNYGGSMLTDVSLIDFTLVPGSNLLTHTLLECLPIYLARNRDGRRCRQTWRCRWLQPAATMHHEASRGHHHDNQKYANLFHSGSFSNSFLFDRSGSVNLWL